MLSFIVPVYQEHDGLAALWAALAAAGDRAVAAGTVARWEAVLVDDGSTDATAAVLQALPASPARTICTHPTNRGIGAALRTGLAASARDLIVYTDADLPFDLGALEELLEPLTSGRLDLVAGYRRDGDHEGWRRAVQSAAYNRLVRTAFGLQLVDVNFACKAATGPGIPASLTSDTGFVDVEWLLLARRAGARIGQVGVAFQPRTHGRSTLGAVSTIGPMLRDLRRIRRDRSLRTADSAANGGQP